MAERTTEQIQIKLKMLDDVFHRMIIALERLETFLEIHRKGDGAAKFATTGMHGERDLHDDQKNPPTLESVLGEVQLQCSALFFQTKFDDEQLFAQTMKYFMTDLLEWYGGRGKEIPYDEVEMYVLPIAVSLSRQISSVVDIMQVCDEYVTKLRRIEDFSDEEKEKAVEEGFTAFLRSAHKRGTIEDGYKRLMDAMTNLYPTTTPAKKVRATFTSYVESLPEFTDEALDAAIAAKGQNVEAETDQEQNTSDEGSSDASNSTEDPREETGENKE